MKPPIQGTLKEDKSPNKGRAKSTHIHSSLIRALLNQAADSLYFMLILQKLWAVQWVWPIIYSLIVFQDISYGHPLIPRHLGKRDFIIYILYRKSPLKEDNLYKGLNRRS